MRATLLILALGALAACGDPLVDSAFRGAPLFSFTGQVATVEGAEAAEGDVRVSLFWAPGGDVASPVADLMEQASVSASLQFPSTFNLTVFHAPEERHLASGGRHGLASLLVYDDRDGDGLYGDGDEVLGGAANKVMLYAARDLSREQSPTGSALTAGFRLVSAPQVCERMPLPDFDAEEDFCDVPVGAPCERDSDCGPGRCLTAIEGLHFPGGYCALPIYDACWLEDDDRQEFEDEFPDGPPEDEPGLYVYKPCTADSHCRVEEGYLCNPGAFECLPDEPVFLDLHSGFEAPPLCADNLSDFDDFFDEPDDFEPDPGEEEDWDGEGEEFDEEGHEEPFE